MALNTFERSEVSSIYVKSKKQVLIRWNYNFCEEEFINEPSTETFIFSHGKQCFFQKGLR